jgi:hypothetical protein
MFAVGILIIFKFSKVLRFSNAYCFLCIPFFGFIEKFSLCADVTSTSRQENIEIILRIAVTNVTTNICAASEAMELSAARDDIMVTYIIPRSLTGALRPVTSGCRTVLCLSWQ